MVRAAMQMQPVHPETLWWDNIIAEVSLDPSWLLALFAESPPAVDFLLRELC
eukprot:COSAG06_NODE_1307_length_9916_cov_99.462361_20_plen_52_part_00